MNGCSDTQRSTQLPPPEALSAHTALFLDFDGTLVEIAPSPTAVYVAPELSQRLRDVGDALGGALAVLSGRTVATVDCFLCGAVACVAGVHGVERRMASGVIHQRVVDREQIEPCLRMLRAFASAHPGVLVEDKGASVAVHYRSVPDLEHVCQRTVADCAEASHGTFERLAGKMVAELKPVGVTKAGALRAYMSEAPFVGRRPVFVGDDLTDESAFVEVSKNNGLGVIVGAHGLTAATAHLPSVAALHAWLGTFAHGGDNDHSHP